MYKTYFHDLTNGINVPKVLDRIPRIGDTIAFASRNSFFLVKGVTQNSFENTDLPAEYPIEIYAVEIGQSAWIHSLRE